MLRLAPRWQCGSEPSGKGAVGRHAYRAEIRVVLHEEFLELGQNVLAVGVLAQRGDVGTDLVH